MFILESLQLIFGIISIVANATVLMWYRYVQRHLVSAWGHIILLILIGLVLASLGILETINYVKTGKSYNILFLLAAFIESCITIFVTRSSWKNHRFIFILNLVFILLCIVLGITSLIL